MKTIFELVYACETVKNLNILHIYNNNIGEVTSTSSIVDCATFSKFRLMSGVVGRLRQSLQMKVRTISPLFALKYSVADMPTKCLQNSS